MRTSPEVYATRLTAERRLWAMANDGRADSDHDRRYRALVLLTTFASLRWGEATALRRCDLDLDASAPCACAPPSPSGPPANSYSARRSPGLAAASVGIPSAIIPALREHLSVFVGPSPGALLFPGAKGGPLRRGNFNKMSAWPHAVRAIGAEGLHFHDLRHTGNTFAAASGAGLRDLMARMGHDSERAAIIYQHEARGADLAITNAIDAHIEAEQRQRRGRRRPAGALSRPANGTLMARKINKPRERQGPAPGHRR